MCLASLLSRLPGRKESPPRGRERGEEEDEEEEELQELVALEIV